MFPLGFVKKLNDSTDTVSCFLELEELFEGGICGFCISCTISLFASVGWATSVLARLFINEDLDSNAGLLLPLKIAEPLGVDFLSNTIGFLSDTGLMISRAVDSLAGLVISSGCCETTCVFWWAIWGFSFSFSSLLGELSTSSNFNASSVGFLRFKILIGVLGDVDVDVLEGALFKMFKRAALLDSFSCSLGFDCSCGFGLDFKMPNSSLLFAVLGFLFDIANCGLEKEDADGPMAML